MPGRLGGARLVQRKVRACVGCNQRTKHKVCPKGPAGSVNIGWGVLTKDLGVKADSGVALSSA